MIAGFSFFALDTNNLTDCVVDLKQQTRVLSSPVVVRISCFASKYEVKIVINARHLLFWLMYSNKRRKSEKTILKFIPGMYVKTQEMLFFCIRTKGDGIENNKEDSSSNLGHQSRALSEKLCVIHKMLTRTGVLRGHV